MHDPALFSLRPMSLCRVILALALMALLPGCTPQPEAQSDDQKDPFFLLGRRLVTERDFKGAVDAFEKALELNPRSVMAHYEVGLLYETKLNEPAIALFHYKQVIRLRPTGHPAEIVMARMKGCEQEIAKNVALVQVDPAVMAELERLKEENRRLQRDLETMRALASTAVPIVYTNPPSLLPPRSTNQVGGLDDLRPGPSASSMQRDRLLTNSPLSSVRRSTNQPVLIPPSNPRSHSSTSSSSPTGPTRSKPNRIHYVRDRETFSAIARKYGVGLAALRAANPTISPERLRPGQAIQIPGN